MSTKNSVLVLAERIARQIVAEQTRARLQMGYDAAILAAHEVFNMGPGRAGAFADAWNAAMDELATMWITDADDNGDCGLTWAKAKRDEAIRAIVGEENFVPFEVAYGEAYLDELRRVRSGKEKS